MSVYVMKRYFPLKIQSIYYWWVLFCWTVFVYLLQPQTQSWHLCILSISDCCSSDLFVPNNKSTCCMSFGWHHLGTLPPGWRWGWGGNAQEARRCTWTRPTKTGSIIKKMFCPPQCTSFIFRMSEHVKSPWNKNPLIAFRMWKQNKNIVTHECFLFHEWGQVMDLDYWIKSKSNMCLKLAPSALDWLNCVCMCIHSW